jgi:hypothetical protein
MNQPYKVYVIVDPEFGERLGSLPRSAPVWIVNTPANTIVAHRLWQERPTDSHLDGITTFEIGHAASREESLISKLNTIDLHHGADSADPPYSEMEVFGTSLSQKLKLALMAYGFDDFLPTPNGFRAIRKLE